MQRREFLRLSWQWLAGSERAGARRGSHDALAGDTFPERFPVGIGDGGVPGRRRMEHRRSRRIDLGSFRAHAGQDQGRRQRRRRLRQLSPLRRRHRDHAQARHAHVSLFDFVAARAARRTRRGERERSRLLQARHRCAARSEHPSVPDAVSLGSAAGTRRRRRLAEPRHRATHGRLREDRRRCARRSHSAMDDLQRTEDLYARRLLGWHARAGSQRIRSHSCARRIRSISRKA